ncbi:sensor histidine kinase [Actinacidiphila rubida]|uniref:sensor histidine kinase n=1 Tax=Actinacidiphila rubida TaxID=310780 RepID=UPI000945B4A9|nr:histidine kinase [Actinacidiphila rubida]
MLRTAMWMVRTAAVVLVGISVFAQPPHGPVAFPFVVAAYALGVAAIGGWAVLDVFPGPARRHPLLLPAVVGVVAVSAGAGCTVQNAGEMVALSCMATVEAGGWTRLARGWTVLGAGVLAVAVGTLAGGLDRAGAIGYSLLLLVGLLAGHNRRSLRVQAEQSAAMVQQVERLRVEQRRVAVLDERARIAREIHDVLAHSLGALGIQIQAARALLAEGPEPATVGQADGVLAKAQRIASDGLAETRRAVHALRADTPPLDEELARMAAAHEERHGAAVTVAVTGRRGDIPAEHDLALVRTAQESLVNAAKHAPHRPVDVRLAYGDDDVTLTVGNPLGPSGSGDFATLNSGYGLTGMRERLLLLGGTLTAGPVADTGDGTAGTDGAGGVANGGAGVGRWTVTARVPR